MNFHAKYLTSLNYGAIGHCYDPKDDGNDNQNLFVT